MGSPWVLSHPGYEDAFKRDWALGLTLGEMAALYGFRNLNSVTRAARRLGLPQRPGGPTKMALDGGTWVTVRGVQRWVPDVDEDEEGEAS